MNTNFINDCNVFCSEESNVDYYRIPSIILTNNNVLIACADARYDTSYDNPNRIDKVIKRSFDFGASWENEQLVVICTGKGREDGEAAIDPALLLDSEKNIVWMIYSHTPGGIGLHQSKPARGCDDDGNRYVYDKLKNKYILKNGCLFDNDSNDIGVKVLENGDVLKDEKILCNIYAGKGEYLVERTSYLQAIYSEDDGKTWSKPIDLTHMVKEDWMCFIGPGPGIGIQLKSEKYKGRLLFPIYFSNSTNASTPKLSCAIIYSDDHGKTWKRGDSPNDGRLFDEEIIHSRTLQNKEAELTESQAVELTDGTIVYFLRNHTKDSYCAYCKSNDGAQTWSEVKLQSQLIDPICQSSVIKLNNVEGDNLIFINPECKDDRKNGTVKLSKDGGETWETKLTLTPEFFMYSSCVCLPDNTIGVLFEGDSEMKNMRYVRFDMNLLFD